MSKFSEKCKELIKENGTNVYRLSVSSSLERTKLQRMVTGKRLPDIDFVKQFCRELRISAPEKKYLMELYQIEDIGEDVYKKRQCIRKLLQRLADLEAIGNDNISSLYTVASTPPRYFFNNLVDYICDTELNIRTVLEKEFSSPIGDSSYIYTNFPVDNDWFFHQLQLLHNKYPNANSPIHHLINFQMNIDLSTHNLTVLSTLLPLALSEELDYTPWYYYSKIRESDFSQLLFPYFFVTPDYVLEISGDLRHSVLHTEKDKISIYKKEFEKIQKLSNPLIMRYATPEAAFEYYTQNIPSVSNDVEELYSLEYQPCFSEMMNEKLLFELLQKNTCYAHMFPALLNLITMFTDSKICGVYTQIGLDSFCQTGKLSGQLGSFLSPFTVTERISALSNFLDRDKLHYHHMVSDAIQLPSHICFEIYGTKSIHIIKIDDNLKISLFVINESSICEAFLDFASSLKNSEYTLSEEKSDQVLQSTINKLKHSIQ